MALDGVTKLNLGEAAALMVDGSDAAGQEFSTLPFLDEMDGDELYFLSQAFQRAAERMQQLSDLRRQTATSSIRTELLAELEA